MTDHVATVVIGRNEGERLTRCLASLAAQGVKPLVYVDSGSSDGSVVKARAMGADVVELDLSTPFTAARARNTGYARVCEIDPDAAFIQFVDGDCEVLPGWIEIALQALKSDPDLAVACGRQYERFPDATIWNTLINAEWDTPVGDVKTCGGNALIRRSALDSVNGFRPDLIAGEEPEMCFRMRQLGWRIRRLEADMNMHDAAMTRWTQWWQRCRRAGFAYAEGMALHGRAPERHKVAEPRRALLWGAGVPALAIIGAVAVSPWFLLFPVLAWGAQTLRLALGHHTLLRAFFLTVGKVPEAQGVFDYWIGQIRGQRRGLIEYK